MGTSQQLRNLEKFSFSVNSHIQVESGKQSTFSSSSTSYEIFLDGILYDLNEDELLSGFETRGVDFVNELEGLMRNIFGK